ncbi:leucine-rich repeat protein kinase family protein [Striga asiatica]|uniref:Leucine-rich repeat protein kinase family protein n=1 Tax=Striga asiatica TaxID=4170 RepID=A0A5A7Q6Q0_STRAF|nr:leucine-rich repeat protein kinase family protein [Striga asiatica]
MSLRLLPGLSASAGEDVHLINFKKSLKDSSALDPTWLPGTDPCNRRLPWLGIDCSETGFDSVSALLLMNLQISATSPEIDIDSLANLKDLRYVSLENNTVAGPIPALNRLGSLKSLFLSGNGLSGEIPADYFLKMGSLKKLQLANNRFSGPIPTSLSSLHNIKEIALQGNGFSGPVPGFDQKSLQVLDLSRNKLDGPIPPAMSRFPAASFSGNPGLCGPPLSRPCIASEVDSSAQVDSGQNSNSSSSSSSESGSITKWVVLGVVVAVLVITILFKAKKEDDSFSVLGKENLDEGVQVHLPSAANRRSMSSSSRRNYSYKESGGAHSSRRGGGKSANDLVVINDEKGVFGLPDLMKAAAEVLGSGGLGSSYKAIMANGVSVVVKRMRDMNKLNKDAFEAEIRRLGRIRHRNVLPPLATPIPTRLENNLHFYLLLGDRGIAHGELNWPTRLKIIKGVARGMGFLHTEFSNYELPHGNLKSSNILLGQNYEPLLTDYALYSLISNTQSVQALFAYKSPEAILYQQLSPKSDVYCLGVVVLEVVTGKFPSQYLNNQKGGTDVVQWARQAVAEGRATELVDPEIAGPGPKEQIERMLRIGVACTEANPEDRVEMREAIRSIEEVQG